MSKQAIADALNKGRLPFEIVDGKKVINLDNPDIKDYQKTCRERNAEKNVGVKVTKKPVNKKPVKVTVPEKTEKVKTVKVKDKEKPVKPEDVADQLDPELLKMLETNTLTNEMIVKLPKSWVEKLRIYEQVKQIKQKREQERRTLIPVRYLRLILGKLFEIHSTEFLTVKSKIIPDLAGIFECNDAEILLKAERQVDEELWRVLQHIKIEFDRFLKQNSEEKLNELPPL